MWFKNIQLYRFTAPFEHSAEDLEQKLSEHTFKPCGKLDPSQYGWVAPMGADFTQLVHTGNGCLMLCARKEEKVLPATVVREKVMERARAIESEEGRRVYRKERDNLKDEIIQDCLPRAFTRSSRTYAYIAPGDGWMLIDAASPGKAEELTSYLRQSLDSLPIVPPQVNDSPAVIMTDWLRGNNVPTDLQLGDECELREPGDDGGIIRCKRQDLTSDEIITHLDAGKQAVKIAVDWDEQLSCMLAEDLSIKRLKFADKLVGEGADAADGDAAAQFDADFALMTAELSRFLPRLLLFFGGRKAAPV